ncbi:imm11 family protein [Ralstonia solanacearum]|uniref:imm11 family protein n=1 Tax=Ralstonia solanacearum TaxID=305 RepID=UPI0006DCDB7D|nr:DUF1629 domain-containing protein [Ralstonia solanacearum]
MNYFLLHHKHPESGYIDGDVMFDPPLDTYHRAGEPLDVSGRIIVVTMDKAVRKLKTDFFLTTSGAFFASEAFAELLKRHQTNLQIVPAEARYASGKPTEKRYCLVHADHRLPAFDYQRSQYAGKGLALQRLERGESPDSFLAKGVQSIVIDEECAAGHHYFFLKNVALIDPIVSSELVHAIRDRALNVPLESLST